MIREGLEGMSYLKIDYSMHEKKQAKVHTKIYKLGIQPISMGRKEEFVFKTYFLYPRPSQKGDDENI